MMKSRFQEGGGGKEEVMRMRSMRRNDQKDLDHTGDEEMRRLRRRWRRSQQSGETQQKLFVSTNLLQHRLYSLHFIPNNACKHCRLVL